MTPPRAQKAPPPTPVPDELVRLCGYIAAQLETSAMSPIAAARRLREAHKRCEDRWAEQRVYLERVADVLVNAEPSGEVTETIGRKLVDMFQLDVELPEPVPIDALADPYPTFRSESAATRRITRTDD